MIKVFHNRIALIKTIFWSIISVVLILPVYSAKAVEPSPSPGGSAKIDNPLDSTSSFSDLIYKIADIVFKIGVPIAVIFLLYSGLLFVTARGNEEKLKTAKKTFWWAILGTAVLLGAKVLAMAIEATVKSF